MAGTIPKSWLEYFNIANAKEGIVGADTVEWLAARPWCSGRIGSMAKIVCGPGAGPYGISESAAPDRHLARCDAEQ